MKFGEVTATDNCQLVELTHADQTQQTTCGAIHTRTWTATDAQGNSSTAQQTITVADTEAPVLSISDPEDLFYACSDDAVWTEISAEDNCTLVSLTTTDTVDGDACGEIRTRTWTATDACGNVATAHQTMILTDDEAPEFEGPATEMVTVPAGTDFVPETPDFYDNCNTLSVVGPTVTSTPVTTTYVWTAPDACGNTASKKIVAVHRTRPSTNLNDDEPFGDLFLYPNPTPVDLTVELEAQTSGWGRVEVLSLRGERLYTDRIAVVAGFNQFTIDTEQLPAGTYLLRLTQNDEGLIRRFVKLNTSGGR